MSHVIIDLILSLTFPSDFAQGNTKTGKMHYKTFGYLHAWLTIIFL